MNKVKILIEGYAKVNLASAWDTITGVMGNIGYKIAMP